MDMSRSPTMSLRKYLFLLIRTRSNAHTFTFSFCKAAFMNTIGKRTPIFLRFSTVAGERGANDCDRDPRGFAIKHYTEEGNYDMVGNNTPVFFIKDPIKFPDFIHSQKRHP